MQLPQHHELTLWASLVLPLALSLLLGVEYLLHCLQHMALQLLVSVAVLLSPALLNCQVCAQPLQLLWTGSRRLKGTCIA